MSVALLVFFESHSYFSCRTIPVSLSRVAKHGGNFLLRSHRHAKGASWRPDLFTPRYSSPGSSYINPPPSPPYLHTHSSATSSEDPRLVHARSILALL
jgi:hypothetical protein